MKASLRRCHDEKDSFSRRCRIARGRGLRGNVCRRRQSVGIGLPVLRVLRVRRAAEPGPGSVDGRHTQGDRKEVGVVRFVYGHRRKLQ